MPKRTLEFAAHARVRIMREFMRPCEVLDVSDSRTYAAGRLMHSEDDALPVVENGRCLGMLWVAGLCHARLDRRPS